MKLKRIILGMLMLCAAAAFSSCDDWTEAESVDIDASRPDAKDPAAWAAYTATVRAYKATDHTLVYACLLNAPAVSTSERDFLRSLPDSVDIVSLQNAPSEADLADLPLMHELGTRVLYPLRPGDDASLAALAVSRHGFDGVALLAERPFADLSATLQTLGKPGLLVYEGDPSGLAAADLAAFDRVVLPTAQLIYQSDMDLLLDNAALAGLAPGKLIFAVTPGAVLRDYRNRKQDAMTFGTQITTSNGLGGIGLYDIGRDYYHVALNYLRTRELIARLNLTPKN